MKKLLMTALLAFTIILSVEVAYAEKPIDFTLNDLNGKAVTLSELKGKKVLINFFATWCPSCRVELKHINKLIAAYPQEKYIILCVSVDDSLPKLKSFMEKNQYNMNVLFDADQNIAAAYGVTGIPSLFLVNEEGDLVWNQAGALEEADLKKLLGI